MSGQSQDTNASSGTPIVLPIGLWMGHELTKQDMRIEHLKAFRTVVRDYLYEHLDGLRLAGSHAGRGRRHQGTDRREERQSDPEASVRPRGKDHWIRSNRV